MPSVQEKLAFKKVAGSLTYKQGDIFIYVSQQAMRGISDRNKISYKICYLEKFTFLHVNFFYTFV